MFMVAQHPEIELDQAPEIEWWRFWLDDRGGDAGDIRWGGHDPSRDEIWDRLGDFA